METNRTLRPPIFVSTLSAPLSCGTAITELSKSTRQHSTSSTRTSLLLLRLLTQMERLLPYSSLHKPPASSFELELPAYAPWSEHGCLRRPVSVGFLRLRPPENVPIHETRRTGGWGGRFLFRCSGG